MQRTISCLCCLQKRFAYPWNIITVHPRTSADTGYKMRLASFDRKRVGRIYGRTDGQTDGRTDGQTDGRTHG